MANNWHSPQSDGNSWSALFSAPLNPDVFAALEANGVLPQVPPNQHTYIHQGSHHQSSTSWSQSSSISRSNNPQRSQYQPKIPQKHNHGQYESSLTSVPSHRHGLAPSLWMSTPSNDINPAVNLPLNYLSTSTLHDLPPSTSSHSHTPISPSSDSKSTLLTDIFSDDLFSQQKPPLSPTLTSTYTSPRVSGSPDLKVSPDPEIDPEQLAKDDPLATQVWKLYARTKGSLPHAQRMENITWRMMALALKKKKEEEESIAAALATKPSSSFSDSARKNQSSVKSCSSSPPTDTKDHISHLLHQQQLHQQAPSERGRRIDKGKAKVRVVGFDGMNQDEGDIDQQESVSALRSHHIYIFTYMPHLVLRQWTGVL